MRRKPKGIFILDGSALRSVYGDRELARIERLVDLYAPPQTPRAVASAPEFLRPAEVVLSSWGGPVLDERFLDAAPQLRAVLHAAGGMGSMLTPAVWERGITVSSANGVNAVPVAQYTLAVLLFSLKHGWRLARETRERRTFVDRDEGVPGCCDSTVGLISLGTIARKLLALLRPFEFTVLVYDPYLPDDEAAALGVRKASLEELFERCDAVSLHSPCLPETRGMIRGRHLLSMRPGATFVNTARASIVRQDELIEVAARRGDLQFVLDVAEPEPPEPTSRLYTLPNVVLTPHMAGSTGPERRCMGRFIADELERYVAGEPLQGVVTPESALHSTHRPVGLTAEVFPRAVAQSIAAAAGAANVHRGVLAGLSGPSAVAASATAQTRQPSPPARVE